MSHDRRCGFLFDRRLESILRCSPLIHAVVLLRPVPGNERFGLGPFFRIEPLGMEYIASALEAAGHTATIADLRFSRSLEYQLRSTRPPSVGLIGIAAMHALETDDVMALARRVRQLAPGVPIVIGGHTAAAYPHPFIASVDGVISDDGEMAVPDRDHRGWPRFLFRLRCGAVWRGDCDAADPVASSGTGFQRPAPSCRRIEA